MARNLYLPQTHKLGFPLGLIGNMLLKYADTLQAVAFKDNEHGDEAGGTHDVLDRHVRRRINVLLARSGKPLRVTRLEISHLRHHTLVIGYEVYPAKAPEDEPQDAIIAAEVSMALFEPSKKAQAQERAAEAAGEAFEIAAPARGAKKRKNRRPRRRKPGQPSVAPPQAAWANAERA